MLLALRSLWESPVSVFPNAPGRVIKGKYKHWRQDLPVYDSQRPIYYLIGRDELDEEEFLLISSIDLD